MENTIATIPSDMDAIYLLPVFDEISEKDIQIFLNEISNRGIPSMALFGELYLENGALLGYEANDNLQRIPRRIAIDVMKIVEGANAADLPVEITTYNETLLINMNAARQSGNYPTFDLMSEATVLNLEVENTARKTDAAKCHRRRFKK